VLFTPIICEGWRENFDEAGVARTLRYFKLVAEYGYPQDAEYDAAFMAEESAALRFLFPWGFFGLGHGRGYQRFDLPFGRSLGLRGCSPSVGVMC
jgi:hypothetical protein